MTKAILAILIVLVALPAIAQQFCGPRAGVVKQLTKEYKETRAALGIVSTGNVMEIFVGASGSWTILATRPDGTTCAVAAGEHFELMAPLPKPQGTAL